MINSPGAPLRINRKHLKQVVAGLIDGIVFIEPDHSIAWANDAALDMHGATDLRELGATIEEYCKTFQLRYRNHHRLRPDQYPFRRVLSGQAFTDVTVEVTRENDVEFRRIHQVRGLVLTEGDDAQKLPVLIIKDVTQRFMAENQFEKTFDANPAPALICRLSDLRYVKVNDGFLDMTGYTKSEVIGRHTYALDVFEQSEDRGRCIDALNGGTTIPQTEASLRLPGGDKKSVVVAGQPIDMGEEPCMLLTFIDLDPRKCVEDTLRHTEERFSKAFRLAPIPMVINGVDGPQLFEANDAFLDFTGYAANEIADQDISELDIWEDESEWRQIATEIESANGVQNRETLLHTRDGVPINCLVSADAVNVDGQRCVLCMMQDITDRKRSEVELFAAIEAVMRDTSWFSHMLLERLSKIPLPNNRKPADALKYLTRRERDVLELVCLGLDDMEIARRLNLSRNTVRNHISALYSKLGVHRRAAVIVWAREHGATK
jgi:PAS domain S-box-containing protein